MSDRIDVTSGMTREELQAFADSLLDNVTRLTEAICRKYPQRWWQARSGIHRHRDRADRKACSMSHDRAIRMRTVPLSEFLAGPGPRYCRNCGDPFDVSAENAACREPSGAWRPCPNPTPGRPLVDCGVGGHMYTDPVPRVT